MSDLTSEERALVAKLARSIVERRLSAPAIFMLESMRPMRFVASQAMLFFAPVIELAVQSRDWPIAQTLVEKREGLDALLDAIERYDAESNERPGHQGKGESSGGDS